MSGRYEKLKRNELRALVEAEYGLAVKDMHEGDKGILLHTDKGIKRFKKVNSDESKILFAASAYEYVSTRGFSNISCINPTITGVYSVRYDKHTYILQSFTKGKVYEVHDEGAAEKVGRALAELHIAGEGFVPAPGSRARVDWGKWMDKFKANCISLSKYKEMALQKEDKSKFDRLFLENVDRCIERMYTSYQLLKENGYLEKVRQAMACNQITHGEFKRHAVMQDEEGEVFITNFEDCTYDICECDIATLLDSFSGKNRNRLMEAALEGYSAVKPLGAGSLKIIEAFLICPKRFFKVAESYYGKKKSYNEQELYKKLERSIKRSAR